MPFSDTRLRPWVRDQLAARGAADWLTAIDVGAGNGSAPAGAFIARGFREGS